MNIGEYVQHADWKLEKHVPVIDGPDEVGADEMFEVEVTIGKEIAHPNTTEHYIAWINLYFIPYGDKYAHEVGHYEFSGHGASVEGPNTGPVYTHHGVKIMLKVSKSGVLQAASLSNIHGLWEYSKEIKVKEA